MAQVVREDANQEVVARIRMLLDAYDEAEEEALSLLENQLRNTQVDDPDADLDSDEELEFKAATRSPDVEEPNERVQLGSRDGRRLLSDDVEERRSQSCPIYMGFDALLREYFRKYYPAEDVCEKAIEVCLVFKFSALCFNLMTHLYLDTIFQIPPDHLSVV